MGACQEDFSLPDSLAFRFPLVAIIMEIEVRYLLVAPLLFERKQLNLKVKNSSGQFRGLLHCDNQSNQTNLLP